MSSVCLLERTMIMTNVLKLLIRNGCQAVAEGRRFRQ